MPETTILVVEDDGPVRRVVTAVLEDMGYRVLSAESAEEALRVAHQAKPCVDLVLLDVVLAGRSGVPLARQLGVGRVVFMSGHADATLARHGIDPERQPILRKAFTPAELARAVREALE
jgi:CheY-like chemotaxis protein